MTFDAKAWLAENLDANGDLAPPWARFPEIPAGSIESRIAYLRRHPPAPRPWASSALALVDPTYNDEVIEADEADEARWAGLEEMLEREGIVGDDVAFGAWVATPARALAPQPRARSSIASSMTAPPTTTHPNPALRLPQKAEPDIDALNAALDCAHEGATDPSCPTPVTNAVDQLRVPLLAMEDSLDDLLACYPNASSSEQLAAKPALEAARWRASLFLHWALRAATHNRHPLNPGRRRPRAKQDSATTASQSRRLRHYVPSSLSRLAANALRSSLLTSELPSSWRRAPWAA